MTERNETTGRDAASREATDWLILLQEAPEDRALLRRFRDWQRRSAANAAAWEATRRASAAIGQGRPAHADRWGPFLAGRRGGTGPGRTESARIARRRALGLGGLALAAGLAAVAVVPRLVLELGADYATATAETATLRLSDGSLVTLAPESAIRVAEGEGRAGAARAVELLEGQAFFEVAPDAGRPFRVASAGVEVTVLGTAFEVRRGAAATAVAVEHGAVRVEQAEAAPPVAEILEPGQTLRVSRGGGTLRGSLPAGQIAAWRHNRLIAQDQPLGAVVDRLRPYYAGRILVTDDGLARRPVTGVYDLADPLAALRAVARAQGAVVRRVAPWLLLVSPS